MNYKIHEVCPPKAENSAYWCLSEQLGTAHWKEKLGFTLLQTKTKYRKEFFCFCKVSQKYEERNGRSQTIALLSPSQ